MLHNIVRWRHTLKIDASNDVSVFLVFSSSPTATAPMRRDRVISFTSALISTKRFGQKENWPWRDLNPQPSDLIHDELDHRTTVSYLGLNNYIRGTKYAVINQIIVQIKLMKS